MNVYIVLLKEDFSDEHNIYDQDTEIISYDSVSDDMVNELSEARKNLLVKYGATPGTETCTYYVDIDWVLPKNKKVDISHNIKRELLSMIRDEKIEQIEGNKK